MKPRKIFLALAVFVFGLAASVQAANLNTVTTNLVCKNPDGTTIMRHDWDYSSGGSGSMWSTSYGPQFWELLSGTPIKAKILFKGWGDTQVKYSDRVDQTWIVSFSLPEGSGSYSINLTKYCNRIAFTYSGVSYRVTDVVWGLKDQALNATTLKNNTRNVVAPKDSKGRYSFPVTRQNNGTKYCLYLLFDDGDVAPVSVEGIHERYGDLTLPFGATRSVQAGKKINIDALNAAKSKTTKLTDTLVIEVQETTEKK